MLKVHYVITLILFLGVPIISVVHYLVTISFAISEENLLRAWTIVYPLSGLCFIAFYFLFITEVLG